MQIHPIGITGAPSTDNAIPRWDGTSGNILQNSGIIVDDSDNMSRIRTIASGTITITSGDLRIVTDNFQLELGALSGGDFNLYHDGAVSHIQNRTGNLRIENKTSDSDIIFEFDDGGVQKTITIDASENKIIHNDNTALDMGTGTFNSGAITSSADVSGVNARFTGALYLEDATTNRDLIIKAEPSKFNNNYTLQIDLAQDNRILRIQGNPTIGDWFNQSVKAGSSPAFASIGVFGDTNLLSFTTGILTINGTTIPKGNMNFFADKDIQLNGTGKITLFGSGAVTAGSEGFKVGSLTITDGLIIDSGGTIDFGNENLGTTGRMFFGNNASSSNLDTVLIDDLFTDATLVSLAGLRVRKIHTGTGSPSSGGNIGISCQQIDKRTLQTQTDPKIGDTGISAQTMQGLFGGASFHADGVIELITVTKPYISEGLHFIGTLEGTVKESLETSVNASQSFTANGIRTGADMKLIFDKDGGANGYFRIETRGILIESTHTGTFTSVDGVTHDDYGIKFDITHTASGSITSECTLIYNNTNPGADTNFFFRELQSLASVHSGNMAIGGTSAPTNKLDVNGLSTFGDGGSTNYTEISSTGDLTFVGTAGLPYGEMYTDDNATDTVLAAQDTWYDVTIFSVNGLSNNTTVDHTDDTIKIVKAGVYLVTVSLDMRSSASNAYYFSIFKGKVAGTEFHNLETRRTTTVADKPGSVSMSGLIDVAVDNTISLGIKRTDGGGVTKSILLEHANITIVMIGGI